LFLNSSQTNLGYKIFTLSGKLIEEGIYNGEIDLIRLEKGTYFIEIIGVRPRLFSFMKN